MQYTCTLPTPPSGNALYAYGKRGIRYPTKRYKDWQQKVKELGLTFPAGFPERQRWTIEVNAGNLLRFPRRPHPRGRDLDNIVKAALDLLVFHCGLKDDYVDDVHLYRTWGEDAPPHGSVIVTIKMLEGQGEDGASQ